MLNMRTNWRLAGFQDAKLYVSSSTVYVDLLPLLMTP